MSERGVCICPECGLQFADAGKVDLEMQVRKYRQAELRRDWIRRPRYRFYVWRLARRVRRLRKERAA